MAPRIGNHATPNFATVPPACRPPRARPANIRLQIAPLAEALGLKIDTRAGRDDTDGLVDHIQALDHDATALVCWEHKALHDIAKALGVHHAPHYDSDDYDVQWTVREGALVSAHEDC